MSQTLADKKGKQEKQRCLWLPPVALPAERKLQTELFLEQRYLQINKICDTHQNLSITLCLTLQPSNGKGKTQQTQPKRTTHQKENDYTLVPNVGFSALGLRDGGHASHTAHSTPPLFATPAGRTTARFASWPGLKGFDIATTKVLLVQPLLNLPEICCSRQVNLCET